MTKGIPGIIFFLCNILNVNVQRKYKKILYEKRFEGLKAILLII